ncbi:MAG: hypothetical protein MSB10_01805 [Clostridiales bacterium]|uniref:hypothetical protein n=1 Tax=Flavonifractor porci TaxID=3133422 RepID=UPI0030967786|nr:hypothetical protein [Clostridiales bacterium]
MNEIDREIGLVLLKRLWQRDFISEELYYSACRSRVLDRKYFSGHFEEKILQEQREDWRYDAH